jgi:hypothetical protein
MRHLEPEDILRQALHQAAESVEPATDGLSRIRSRLATPRPLVIAWIVACWETVSQFVMLRLEPVLAALAGRLSTGLRTAEQRLQPAAERLQPVTDRLRPAFGWLLAAAAWLRRVIKPHGSDERPSRYAWVRPAIAMAAVVLVAVAGGFALSGLPHQISQAAQSVFSTGQTHGSGGGTRAPGTSGGGHQLGTAPGGATTRGGASPTPSPSCSPTAKRKPKPSPTPTPSPSPTTPSPSPTTPSPSPSTQPTPTPSPSGSGDSSPSPSTDQGPQSASAAGSAQLSAAVFLTSVQSSPSPSPSC